MREMGKKAHDFKNEQLMILLTLVEKILILFLEQFKI
jgi:hypothetical protein